MHSSLVDLGPRLGQLGESLPPNSLHDAVTLDLRSWPRRVADTELTIQQDGGSTREEEKDQSRTRGFRY